MVLLRKISVLTRIKAMNARALSSVPVIDISALRSPPSTEEGVKAVGDALVTAASEIGLFYISGHGVPESLLTESRDQAGMFFSKSLTWKSQFGVGSTPGRCRGYQAMGENVTEGQRDAHEAFDVYRDKPVVSLPSSSSVAETEVSLCGTTTWPEPRDLPRFRPTFEEYVRELQECGHALARGLAVGMGLPKHFFAPHFTDPFWVMRLIHYPNEEVAQKDHLDNGIGAAAGGLGCGRHTDYGFLTVVNQDTLAASHSNGGPSSLCLEAETRSGHWVVVPPLEGALAVNVGDMLETWSGGALRATPHRVRRIAPASAGLSGYLNNGACTVSPGASTPPPEHRSLGRLSVPFFFEPNYDSLIQPLQSPPGSKLEALQHRFGANLEADSGLVAPFRAPVKYGDHLLRKIQGNFDLEN